MKFIKDLFWSKELSVADKQRIADYKRLHAEGLELDKRVEETHAWVLEMDAQHGAETKAGKVK